MTEINTGYRGNSGWNREIMSLNDELSWQMRTGAKPRDCFNLLNTGGYGPPCALPADSRPYPKMVQVMKDAILQVARGLMARMERMFSQALNMQFPQFSGQHLGLGNIFNAATPQALGSGVGTPSTEPRIQSDAQRHFERMHFGMPVQVRTFTQGQLESMTKEQYGELQERAFGLDSYSGNLRNLPNVAERTQLSQLTVDLKYDRDWRRVFDRNTGTASKMQPLELEAEIKCGNGVEFKVDGSHTTFRGPDGLTGSVWSEGTLNLYINGQYVEKKLTESTTIKVGDAELRVTVDRDADGRPRVRALDIVNGTSQVSLAGFTQRLVGVVSARDVDALPNPGFNVIDAKSEALLGQKL